MKKKAKGKGTPKAPKRRRFVKGLIEGKSMRRAALDAGYSQAMADHAGEKIFPGARAEFQDELRRKIPHGALIRRIAEGLNAKETKLTQFEGQYTDQRYLVDWSERRRYAELAAKLLGYLVEQVELGGIEDGPLNVNLHVDFVEDEKASD